MHCNVFRFPTRLLSTPNRNLGRVTRGELEAMIEEIKVGTLVHFIVIVFYRHFTRTVRNNKKFLALFSGCWILINSFFALDSTKKNI